MSRIPGWTNVSSLALRLVLFAGVAVCAQLAGPAWAGGSIVTWGINAVGEGNVPSPNTGFVAVAAGYYSHSLGLKADGSIVAWGDNRLGQCNVPSPNTGFVAVAAGGYHNLGLKADGSIVAWGTNAYGEGNVPSPNAGFIAIAAGGDYHSLGLKADGFQSWPGDGTTMASATCPRRIPALWSSRRVSATVWA